MPVADMDPAVLVQHLPVDGEALGTGELAIDKLQGANMVWCHAAAVGRDPTATHQRRPEYRRLPVCDRGGTAGLLQHLRLRRQAGEDAKAIGDALGQGKCQPMDQCCRNVLVGFER